jgi:hypothetical protein
MVQHTLSHTEVLEVSADDLWEVAKQFDEILPALEPDYFTTSTYIEGIAGEPGSIRLVKPGPGITTYLPSHLELCNLVLPNSTPEPTLHPSIRSS